MGLKGLLSRRFKKTGNERNNDKELSREIILFIDKVKKEYYLDDFVNVQLSDELPINQGRIIIDFENSIFTVKIGVKECRERNELSDSEWITLKNTIVHELTHAKNRRELTQDTQEKLNDNIHSLPYFAMHLIDEYNAYKTADNRFRQSVATEESLIQRALKPFWFNEHFIKETRLDDNSRYDHFYDDCTAIIIHSIRNIRFPSIPETYRGYNDMCKKIIEILSNYNSMMPLSYDKYEEAGGELWNALLIMVPNNLRSNFKKNVGIRF